jgi:putative endonuclease
MAGEPKDTTSTATTKQRGDAAEALAAAHLQRHGLTIVARNFRCRGGEIDLIARDGRVLVFVEVRLRSPSAYGDAAASISPRKQQRIILAARHYLAALPGSTPDCRFDCVLLERLDAGALSWLKHAFTTDA